MHDISADNITDSGNLAWSSEALPDFQKDKMANSKK